VPDDVENQLRRRQYRDPPVIEGIARFQWTEPVPWSFTTPGLLFEQLRDDYPGEPTAMAQVSAGIFSEPADSDSPDAGFELRAGPQRFIYANEDGSRKVGVRPSDLSVHGLPPYEGWESVTARLASAITKTAPVLGHEHSVALVGLRYVNRVTIPEAAVDFEDYLNIGIGYPPGFPGIISGFLDRVEMDYEGEPVRLAFTWASTNAPEGTVAFILDIDLYARCTESVTVDGAFEVLQDLKVKEGRVFEALLKDKLREQFGEIS
jgi:uncharacterized protein (TIGR04255 family)